MINPDDVKKNPNHTRVAIPSNRDIIGCLCMTEQPDELGLCGLPNYVLADILGIVMDAAANDPDDPDDPLQILSNFRRVCKRLSAVAGMAEVWMNIDLGMYSERVLHSHDAVERLLRRCRPHLTACRRFTGALDEYTIRIVVEMPKLEHVDVSIRATKQQSGVDHVAPLLIRLLHNRSDLDVLYLDAVRVSWQLPDLWFPPAAFACPHVRRLGLAGDWRGAAADFVARFRGIDELVYWPREDADAVLVRVGSMLTRLWLVNAEHVHADMPRLRAVAMRTSVACAFNPSVQTPLIEAIALRGIPTGQPRSDAETALADRFGPEMAGAADLVGFDEFVADAAACPNLTSVELSAPRTDILVDMCHHAARNARFASHVTHLRGECIGGSVPMPPLEGFPAIRTAEYGFTAAGDFYGVVGATLESVHLVSWTAVPWRGPSFVDVWVYTDPADAVLITLRCSVARPAIKREVGWHWTEDVKLAILRVELV